MVLGLVALAPAGCREPEPEPEPSACDLGALEASPLRRLTTAAYQNSLRDLFRTPSGETLAVLEPPAYDGLISPETLWLPHEDSIDGYAGNAQGQAISPLLVERYSQNAIDVAAELGARLDEFLACDVDGDPLGCGLAYVEDLAYRAWRRPLTDEERAALSADFADDLAQTASARVAVQIGVATIIQSPHFLYLPELAIAAEDPPAAGCELVALDGYELATRLSYFLWNTTPDAWLLERAAAGELDSREGVAAVAAQMLASPRRTEGALAFAREWLRLDRIHGYAREVLGSQKLDPFVHVPLLREQAERFAAPILAQPDRRFAELLTSNAVPMHGALTELYGVEVPGLEPPQTGDPTALDDVWIEVELPANERAGALTLAGHLSANATPERANPVRRGVFVLDRLLCAEPPPPPADIDTSVVEGGGASAEPTLNRDRYEAHTDSDACRSCHEAIDPFGFAFERYNAAGVHWTHEAWSPANVDDPALIEWLEVDASGVLDGALVPESLRGQAFADAVELMHLLADSPDVHGCYVRHLYRYALGRGLAAGSPEQASADEQLVELMTEDFYASAGLLDALTLAIVTSDPFMHRVVTDDGGPP